MRLVVNGTAGLPVEIHHPRVTPDDADAWRLDVLRGGAAGEVTIVAETPFSTELGWEGTFVAARVGDGHCLAAFYRFFHYVAAAAVRARAAEDLAVHEPAIRTMFLSAHPDSEGDAVGLADLWSDDD